MRFQRESGEDSSEPFLASFRGGLPAFLSYFLSGSHSISTFASSWASGHAWKEGLMKLKTLLRAENAISSLLTSGNVSRIYLDLQPERSTTSSSQFQRLHLSFLAWASLDGQIPLHLDHYGTVLKLLTFLPSTDSSMLFNTNNLLLRDMITLANFAYTTCRSTNPAMDS